MPTTRATPLTTESAAAPAVADFPSGLWRPADPKISLASFASMFLGAAAADGGRLLVRCEARAHEERIAMIMQSQRPPEKSVQQIRQELQRVLDCCLSTGDLPEPTQTEWLPELDLALADKEMTIWIELPGVAPKDVTLKVTGDVLTVAGEKRFGSELHDSSLVQQERPFGRFFRGLQLPAFADPDRVSAEFANGVLTVHLPKSVEAKTHRIPVVVR